MSHKPETKIRDRFSGAEFTVAEISPILLQMVLAFSFKESDEFADRFEVFTEKPVMKVFYCTSFKGHYPIGTSAIVTAETQEVAAQKLQQRLEEIGLQQFIQPHQMCELCVSRGAVQILQDGDY